MHVQGCKYRAAVRKRGIKLDRASQEDLEQITAEVEQWRASLIDIASLPEGDFDPVTVDVDYAGWGSTKDHGVEAFKDKDPQDLALLLGFKGMRAPGMVPYRTPGVDHWNKAAQCATEEKTEGNIINELLWHQMVGVAAVIARIARQVA